MSLAYDEEEPVRQVTIASFFMARYLVTVAEYGGFVKSGGYGKQALRNAARSAVLPSLMIGPDR